MKPGKIRQIHICGAHSVGKTTLVNYLSGNKAFKDFNFIAQEEIARQVIADMKITEDMQHDKKQFLNLNKEILRRIVAKKTAVEKQYQLHGDGSEIILWDRGAVDVLTYIDLLVGTNERKVAQNQSSLMDLLAGYREETTHFTFVIRPCVEFMVNDGVRIELGGFQPLLDYHELMLNLMRELQIKFVEITVKDLHERAEEVVKYIS